MSAPKLKNFRGTKLFERGHLDVFTFGDVHIGKITELRFRVNDNSIFFNRFGKAWFEFVIFGIKNLTYF